MAIHHLSEARVRSAQTEALPWRVALPVIISLSALSWGVIAGTCLGLRRLAGF